MYKTTVTTKTGDHTAICVPWQEVRRILGRLHDGSPEDDAVLVDRVVAEYGEDWQDCDGYLDDIGWYLVAEKGE